VKLGNNECRRVKFPMEKGIPVMGKQNYNNILKVFAAIVLAVSLCGGWLKYSNWYRSTIPTAPVPEGARLLSRNASANGYWSSRTRYWYYEKYSVDKSPEEVEAFYDRVGDAAKPFGYFSVEILPPMPAPGEESPNMGLAAASRRDITDPVGETIILLEVSWDPDELPFSWFY
jgi:hypothetical protein